MLIQLKEEDKPSNRKNKQSGEDLSYFLKIDFAEVSVSMVKGRVNITAEGPTY
jgi:hypothetical protein